MHSKVSVNLSPDPSSLRDETKRQVPCRLRALWLCALSAALEKPKHSLRNNITTTDMANSHVNACKPSHATHTSLLLGSHCCRSLPFGPWCRNGHNSPASG